MCAFTLSTIPINALPNYASYHQVIPLLTIGQFQEVWIVFPVGYLAITGRVRPHSWFYPTPTCRASRPMIKLNIETRGLLLVHLVPVVITKCQEGDVVATLSALAISKSPSTPASCLCLRRRFPIDPHVYNYVIPHQCPHPSGCSDAVVARTPSPSRNGRPTKLHLHACSPLLTLSLHMRLTACTVIQ